MEAALVIYIRLLQRTELDPRELCSYGNLFCYKFRCGTRRLLHQKKESSPAAEEFFPELHSG